MVPSIKENQIATVQAFRYSTCYHISPLRLKMSTAVKVVLTSQAADCDALVDSGYVPMHVALHALCRLQRVSATLTTSNPFIF